MLCSVTNTLTNRPPTHPPALHSITTISREGLLRGECVRGDMYIRDMKNTKGHVTGCTNGVWHPTDKFTAATCSEDGTVRWV